MAFNQFQLDLGPLFNMISELAEPKEKRRAKQKQGAMEKLAQLKAGSWPQEMQEEYLKSFQYDPGVLRSIFRPSERGEDYLFEVPGTEGAKIKTPLKGRVKEGPFMKNFMESWETPTKPVKWVPTSQEEALGFEKAKAGLRPPGAYHPTTREELIALEKEKAGLKPPGRWQPKTEKEALEFEKEKAKLKVKPDKPSSINPATRKDVRKQLMRLYLTDPTRYLGGLNKETYNELMTSLKGSTKTGTPSPDQALDMFTKVLAPEGQRAFDIIAGMAEQYVKKLGVLGAVNQAIKDYNAARGQGGVPQRPQSSATSPYSGMSDADILKELGK